MACASIFVLVFPRRRDVFACIGLPDGDPSWERSFSSWPLGVCDYLAPSQRQFHPEEWAQRTRNLYNWTEPHNRCTRTHVHNRCTRTHTFRVSIVHGRACVQPHLLTVIKTLHLVLHTSPNYFLFRFWF